MTKWHLFSFSWITGTTNAFTILCVLMESEIMSHRNMRTHCEKTSVSTTFPVSLHQVHGLSRVTSVKDTTKCIVSLLSLYNMLMLIEVVRSWAIFFLFGACTKTIYNFVSITKLIHFNRFLLNEVWMWKEMDNKQPINMITGRHCKWISCQVPMSFSMVICFTDLWPMNC